VYEIKLIYIYNKMVKYCGNVSSVCEIGPFKKVKFDKTFYSVHFIPEKVI